MAKIALMYLITVTVMVQSVCGAPPILSTESNHHIGNQVKYGASKNGSHKSLLVNGLFEGDLEISEEFILEFYDIKELLPGDENNYYNDTKFMLEHEMKNIDETEKKKLEKRAARAGTSRLWINATVPYKFASNITEDIKHRIRDAMDHWEDCTCLRFPLRNSEAAYVKYVKVKTTCSSSSLGRNGSEQTINMDLEIDCNFGTIVHEIGHAIGFWHEQSRPDRDNYVRILTSNIKNDRQGQFKKRRSNQVDSRGSEYDYGSVMHYKTDQYVRSDCYGCQTMEVIDNDLYRAQGSPSIGDWTYGLSDGDVEQTNAMYSCPKSGVTGSLVLYVRNGRSLPDTDPWLNNPDPYVKITAVDSSGTRYVNKTTVQSGTTSPNWNQYISLPEREWQFFRIAIWDDDDFLAFQDDWMSVSETIVPSQGEHPNNRHCSDDNCNGYVMYDYSILDLTMALLTVKVRYARNLEDTDPWLNSPDPYVIVEATSAEETHIKKTHVISGTEDPTWNSNFEFGCWRWVNFITLQVFDDDESFTGEDDEMSSELKTTLQPGNHVDIRHSTNGGGYLIFDYNFIVDGDECSTNPCQNGGTCVDRCSSYSCQCAPNYSGINCEHLYGDLRFEARYARDLRSSDGWWSDSDSYMEIKAENADGITFTKRTEYLNNDRYPDWNEWLNFGIGAWKKYKVRVYDDDYGADDPLSDQYTRTVSWGSHTDERFDCYDGGYAIYDYYFESP